MAAAGAPDRRDRVTARSARFQQWQTLLGNRTKRGRAGRFLVQGVRPISVALEQGWPIVEVLVDADRRLSGWAEDVCGTATVIELSSELMAELGEKDDQVPELLAVLAMPADDLDRIPLGPAALVLVLDRPSSPGNVGSLIRSADAFGASGVVVTGHAADVYDPRAVRASTGSLFAVPTVRVPGPAEALAWLRAAEPAPLIVGTDESGDLDLHDVDLTGPVAVVVGNETTGLSTAWREACDVLARIPITGSASSLNAANAGTVALYEAARQRR